MGEVSFWQYARRCFARARRGAIDLANNWAWIIGAGVTGYLAAQTAHPLMIPAGPYQALLEGAFNMAFAFVVIFGVRLFIWAPYQLYREALGERDAARAEGATPGADSQRRDMERRATAAEFELWEVACWLSAVAPHRPIGGGPAFMELERLRRAAWDGQIKLALKGTERGMFDLARNAKAAGFDPKHEINETQAISRDELLGYLQGIGATIPGIN